jgi:hypothetical protein
MKKSRGMVEMMEKRKKRK